jgi:hypothetical protein
MPIFTTLFAQCENVPQTWAEPLYVPILFTMLGAGLFAAGKAAEMRENKPVPWKWIGFLPMVFALYSGLRVGSCMLDSFYWQHMNELAAKKFQLSHFGGFLVPLLTMTGLLIWHWQSTKDPFRDTR